LAGKRRNERKQSVTPLVPWYKLEPAFFFFFFSTCRPGLPAERGGEAGLCQLMVDWLNVCSCTPWHASPHARCLRARLWQSATQRQLLSCRLQERLQLAVRNQPRCSAVLRAAGQVHSRPGVLGNGEAPLNHPYRPPARGCGPACRQSKWSPRGWCVLDGCGACKDRRFVSAPRRDWQHRPAAVGQPW